MRESLYEKMQGLGGIVENCGKIECPECWDRDEHKYLFYEFGREKMLGSFDKADREVERRGAVDKNICFHLGEVCAYANLMQTIAESDGAFDGELTDGDVEREIWDATERVMYRAEALMFDILGLDPRIWRDHHDIK